MTVRFSSVTGTPAYVDLSPPNILPDLATEVTVGMWLYIDSPTNPPSANSTIVGDNGKFQFDFANGGGFRWRWIGLISSLNNTSDLSVVSSAIPYDQWNFIVGRFNAETTLDCFVNGISVATGNTALETLRNAAASTRLQFGHTIVGQTGVTTGFAEWNGLFITNKLLTPQEITDIYNGTLDPADITGSTALVVYPLAGTSTGDTPSIDDESFTDIGISGISLEAFFGSYQYINAASNHTWGIVDESGIPIGDVNLPPVGGIAGSWGLTASTANIPLWLNPTIRRSAVLTRRGWETRLPGTGNSKQMEVVVAGSFGSTVAYNQAPEIYEGAYPLSRILQGVSGASIDPYFIEVVDPDAGLQSQTITVGSTVGLPVGLSVASASDSTSPVRLFRITGTVNFATTGTAYVEFVDAGGSSAVGSITYNISSN